MSVEKAQVVESISRVVVLECIENIDSGKLLYASVRMREHTLLYYPVLLVRLTRHRTSKHRKCLHHQLKVVVADGLHTPIVDHRVNRVALRPLM